MSRLSTVRSLDTSTPEKSAHDSRRLIHRLDEMFNLLPSAFVERWKRTPAVITANTERPFLKWGETATVTEKSARVRLYLPEPKPGDTGRRVIFRKTYPHQAVDVIPSAGLTVNGLPVWTGIYTTGIHEFWWDGARWTTTRTLEATFNVREFGARGDGVTDDTDAVQDALTTAALVGGTVVFPLGTYIFSDQVSVPDGSSLQVYLPIGAVLDFTRATSIPAREACITIGTHNVAASGADGVTLIGTLASSATKGDQSIVLSSAAGLSEGDLFLIYDTVDASWIPSLDGTGGHNSRPYYHAGEHCRVDAVSGATVALDLPLRDSYSSGSAREIYKITRNFFSMYGGGKIICPGTAQTDTGIHLQNCTGRIDSIEIVGARWTAFEMWRCRQMELIGCQSSSYDLDADEGIGVLMLSCEDCWVRGGAFRNGKHGMTMTGGAVFASVPNRRCGAIGATLVGTLTAADMHGHNDNCAYIGCTIDGGCSLGGRNVKLSGGTVRSASDQYGATVLEGLLVRLREVKDGTHTVENVKFELDHLSPQSGSDFPISLDTFDAVGGGRVVMRGCTVAASVHNSKLVYLSAWAGSSGGFEFVVDGFDYDGVAGQKAPRLIIQCVDAEGDAAFSKVTVANTRGIAPEPDNVRTQRLTYRAVDVSGSDGFGILATVVAYAGVTQYIDVLSCITSGDDAAGIYVDGEDKANDVYATVKGNRSLNNGQDGTVSVRSKSSLRAENLKSLEISGNSWGDTQGSPTQGRLVSIHDVTTVFGSGNQSLSGDYGSSSTARSVSGITNDLEVIQLAGSGSPEGSVYGSPGWTYVRTDGTKWTKVSGSATNTGWRKEVVFESTDALALPGPLLLTSATATIASGAITVASSLVKVETEGGAATDDLDTITATNFPLGLFFLQMATFGHNVVVKHGTGNIQLVGGASFTLSNPVDTVLCFHLSGTVYVFLKVDF